MNLDIQIVRGINRADTRFLSFLRKAQMPITERQIIDFYRTYVADEALIHCIKVWNNTKKEFEFEVYNRSERQVRLQALAWFDRCLGRVIRKQILVLDPIKLLPKS